MLSELQQTLRTRYELVSNRIQSLKDELALYEPELQSLLNLIALYSKQENNDPIELERAKIFNKTPTGSAPALTPCTKSEPAPSAHSYNVVSPDKQNDVLLQVFINNNNQTISKRDFFTAFNALSEVPVSYSTTNRILERAVNANILEAMPKDSYTSKCYYRLK